MGQVMKVPFEEAVVAVVQVVGDEDKGCKPD